ncbi:MAG: flavodoxin family protein [Moraxella sp.]|nr:flavodoxin family protein [Moraxella sp.]
MDNKQPSMVIVYHSNYGHTKRVALAVRDGAKERVDVHAIDVAELRLAGHMTDTLWAQIDEAQMIVFASAVYMGSVTADFKAFMEQTSKRWFNRAWQGKLSAGIANSGGLSGDKLSVLQQLCLFAMQHGMHWVGMPLLPTGHSEKDLNRLSSFLGLMVQSVDAPVEETPCQGDMESARWFGGHLADTLLTFWHGYKHNQES